MEDIYAQCSSTSSYSCSSIVDPENELIDPTPDVRALFLQFNDQFFGGALAACEVRWSPRMTLCAGLCHYEGRGGLCSIRLSVPLLKLRPRKDLVQTLLDHDAHGSEFQKHMHRINQATGANITIYHSFHDEVNLYKQHWWRCTGPCRDRKPFYGWVKRAMNRTPGPNDLWWKEHQETCNGQFDKVKEPEGYSKTQKAVKSKHNAAVKSSKKSRVSDGQSRIESYFTSRHKNNNAVSDNCDKQIFLSVTDNTSDTDDVYVECPNCSCIIRESSINNHLDQCLLTTAN